MKSKKTFVVGDVHGCFNEFLNLLKKANYRKETHRLILVGDIINRGPLSLKMLEWVKAHEVETVRGNHEQAFIDSVRKNKILNPHLAKLKKDMKDHLEEWIQWLETLPFYIEDKDFVVVHAGLVPEKKPQDSDSKLLMNIRTWDKYGLNIKNGNNLPWYSYYKKEKLVIYGHWASQGLNVRENTIGLDSGCVYGYRLSGVLLPERKIVQVPALKKYFHFAL